MVKYVIQPDTQIGQLAPAATQSLQPGVTLTVTGSQTADDATVARSSPSTAPPPPPRLRADASGRSV